MKTIQFCYKTKYQIQKELDDLDFTKGQAEQIIARMEEHIREIKGSTVDNFEDYCFIVNYGKTNNGFDFNDVDII
jgi:phage terminase large subunit-like protein